MKPSHRFRRLTVGMSAAGLAVAVSTTGFSPVAHAKPALTATVNPESSQAPAINGYDLDALVRIAEGLAGTVEQLNKNGGTPSIQSSSDAFEIIIDPLTSPDANPTEAAAKLTPSATYMTADKGSTADGRTVVFPTEGIFTSPYGMRWGRMHQGIDIGNGIGTPIYSVMDGTVISAGPAQGYGKWVRVQHANGEISVYGHVHSYSVSVGDKVKAGDQIATMGNEGHSTGPHLHFEIRPDGAAPVDPVPWFANQGITVRGAK